MSLAGTLTFLDDKVALKEARRFKSSRLFWSSDMGSRRFLGNQDILMVEGERVRYCDFVTRDKHDHVNDLCNPRRPTVLYTNLCIDYTYVA